MTFNINLSHLSIGLGYSGFAWILKPKEKSLIALEAVGPDRSCESQYGSLMAIF